MSYPVRQAPVGSNIDRPAATALLANRLVLISTSTGKAGYPAAAPVDKEGPFYVTWEAQATADAYVTLQTLGIAALVVGATVTAGNLVTSHGTQGAVQPATTSTTLLAGQAITSGGVGETVMVVLTPGVLKI